MAGDTEQRVEDAGREAMADRLLALVRAFSAELRAGDALPVTLDTRLDLDLGLDSLSRGQLLLEVERAFGVSLPERVAAEAHSPRDLVRAVRAAGSTAGAAPHAAHPVSPALEPVTNAPDGAGTLADVLAWHVAAHPDRPHVHLLDADGTEATVTYRELADRAARVAGGLVQRGLAPGRSVAIMLPTGADYLAGFLGVILAGGVPVPIYPPARPSQIEDHLRRHAGILGNARATFLLTVPEGKAVSRLLAAHVDTLKGVETTEAVAAGAEPVAAPVLAEGDTAFLQYTSGSTGRPKGVVLTHANLLANIRAMGAALRADSTDVCVSWLPLYHDMGLIGAWLGSLYYAVPLVLMSPLAFLARPSRWLWAVHAHRGTVAAAPNFAYELCLRKVTDAEIEGLDLSSWRVAANGAEPVSPETVRGFCERFGPYGFHAGSMTPVYGLAESSVGLAFPPLGRGARIDRVDRGTFTREGLAKEVGDDDALRFVSAGHPLPGHQIRVVDDDGREVPERREGRLEFRGPSATSGYFRNPEATRALFDGDWLDSGDLGYMAEGEVFITARAKDVIIRAGRNIYPHELDEAVGTLPGVRKGCVVTFAAHDPRSRTERLVILAETREADPAAKAGIKARIVKVATDLLGEPPDDVVLAPPHTVLKTSSGKIRRADSRHLYESGRVGAHPRGVGWQLTRLFVSALVPALRQARRSALERMYAAWAWGLAGLLGPPVWLGIALAPGRGPRWRIAGAGARALAFLSGTRLAVEGAEHVPRAGGFVVAANHSSYLDGFVLAATLPVPVRFVAKAELARRFLPRTLLGRLGVRYVERFDLQRGLADARRIAREAGAGSPLAFFPEGTFQRMPGLQPFHMGAFVAAAEAGVPVVPVAIRGTRSILREGSWFPRRGRVRVTVCPPIHPRGKGWNAAIALRDATRTALLARVGEPDLGAGPSPLRVVPEG